jgi:hypothetical protein
LEDSGPGWYYDRANGLAIYKPFYDDNLYHFTIVLDYRDVDNSGKFEDDVDEYQRLSLRQLPQQ